MPLAAGVRGAAHPKRDRRALETTKAAEQIAVLRLAEVGELVEADQERAAPTLPRLERRLEARKASDAGKSYTKALLDAGPTKIDEKLREEAAELGQALIDESDERVASEAGDLIYHLLVGLVSRGVSLRALFSELSKRFGQSGHEEKAKR